MFHHFPRCATLLLAGLLLLSWAGEAAAIPPPEVARIGALFVQVLAVALIGLSTLGFFLRRHILALFAALRCRRALFLATLAVLGAALLLTARYLGRNGQPALAHPTAPAVVVENGTLSAAGMQFDIADQALAVSPQQAAQLLAKGDGTFIDIREPVEFATRHIPGFANLRAGDLLAGGEQAKLDRSKQVLLACEAGERGSAIAVFLRVRGLQAYYLEGGIRGWIGAKLPFSGSADMQLPDFKNKYTRVALATATELAAAGQAILVDVRAPKEFAAGHLSGARNLPLVNMPSPVLEAQLGQLPGDRPIIAVGYDRFGAYYGLILGHLLSQQGKSFGGLLALGRAE